MPNPRSIETTLYHEFAHQVALRPEATAVEVGQKRISYIELDTLAGRVATGLLREGVGPEVLVGVHLSRSAEFVIAILGVLRAGGAYVPLDPVQPPTWITEQIATASIGVVLSSRADRAGLPSGVNCLILEDLLHESDPPPEPGVHVGPDNLAHVLFTSGSTGRPKAVAVPHRAVIGLVTDQSYAVLDSEQCFLFQSSPTFDASTLEIWGALLHGGRVAVAPPGPVSVGALARLIDEHRVTIAVITPALFHIVVEENIDALRPLRQVISGGEVVSPAALESARATLPGTRLVVVYGPTEATVLTTTYTVERSRPVPTATLIGTPLAGLTTYILDENLDRTPSGSSGELYVSGDGLAMGYLGAADLTAERFLPDPFAARPGARMYRTGDRVRQYDADTLEFIGRIDDQVKIRGHRIEPAQVEQALLAHPEVVSAYVAAEQNSVRGRYLAAYVACRAGGTADQTTLRRHMAEAVPDHLRPDVYIVRAELPVTRHGKIDRRRLLDGDGVVSRHTAADDRRYVVVVNAEEQHAIWPAAQPVPSGWSSRGGVGSKAECKDYVRRAWVDIRPLSQRAVRN
ncbi:amino acid adenylation domain-containing protein [Nocardia sienata]|uniref:amino acid adenylation domain-containing protein n=1 Tax=Nocardia sienata TaxID=248552 RepID=UPI000A061134|nr:amino acid adenylation domain-containing protein [Nocardia sienata]